MSEQEHFNFKGIIMHELEEFYAGELRHFFGNKHIATKCKLQAVCRFVLLRMDAQAGADPEEVKARLEAIKQRMKGGKEDADMDGKKRNTGSGA
jgi:hypothetical protein